MRNINLESHTPKENFKTNKISEMRERLELNNNTKANSKLDNENFFVEKYKQCKEVVSNENNQKEKVKTVDNNLNAELEGKKHPKTGVEFVRKIITTTEGKFEGVFPKFQSFADIKLPKELFKATDKVQFQYCCKKLYEQCQKDEKLRNLFNSKQLEQIKNGDKISGYTWHHNEEPGKMQLVSEKVHAATGHTGGKAIWGGGSENR